MKIKKILLPVFLLGSFLSYSSIRGELDEASKRLSFHYHVSGDVRLKSKISYGKKIRINYSYMGDNLLCHKDPISRNSRERNSYKTFKFKRDGKISYVDIPKSIHNWACKKFPNFYTELSSRGDYLFSMKGTKDILPFNYHAINSLTLDSDDHTIEDNGAVRTIRISCKLKHSKKETYLTDYSKEGLLKQLKNLPKAAKYIQSESPYLVDGNEWEMPISYYGIELDCGRYANLNLESHNRYIFNIKLKKLTPYTLREYQENM